MENHIKYSKGICWIGDCRIPFVDEGDIKSATPGSLNATGEFSLFGLKSGNELDKQGRFTPNLLVCDDMLNDGSVTSIKQNKDYIPPNEPDSIVGFSRGKYSGINDKGTNSRYYDLDKWFDKIIDSL
jgi:hypothetical protein